MILEKYGPAQTKQFIKDQEDKLAKALAEQKPTRAKKVKALDPDDPKNDPRYAERLAKAKAVMQVFDHLREWNSDPDESSTGTSYRQLMQSDGKLSCNCPGWLNYSGGTPKRPFRRCKHIDTVANELRLTGKKFETRSVGKDAYLYVIGVGQ